MCAVSGRMRIQRIWLSQGIWTSVRIEPEMRKSGNLGQTHLRVKRVRAMRSAKSGWPTSVAACGNAGGLQRQYKDVLNSAARFSGGSVATSGWLRSAGIRIRQLRAKHSTLPCPDRDWGLIGGERQARGFGFSPHETITASS